MCAKVGENWTYSNEMYCIKFKMAAAAIMDPTCYFQFCNFSFIYEVTSMCIKFHQDMSIFDRV